MTVVRRSDTPVPGADRTITGARLHEVLPLTDVLVLVLALTAETTGIIDGPELDALPDHAVLVNVARGGHVVTDALVEALQGGRIGGAALDVTDPEPLPREHALNSLDNVIIMPHLGSASEQTRDAMAKMAAANLMAGLEGRELPHRIC